MRALALLAGAAMLSACGDDPATTEPSAPETEIPEELQTGEGARAAIEGGDAAAASIGTPMEERVATIGLLNKRNNLSQDFEMSPGESRRSGNVVIRLAACEQTAPWERPQETGAFVQVIIRDSGEDGEWRKVFSGWLFANSPSLNVVEHPIYDVWVKDCAMSFPGEEDSAPSEDSASSEA